MTWSTAALVLGVIGGFVAGGALVWVFTSNREVWTVVRDDQGQIVRVNKVGGREATHAPP